MITTGRSPLNIFLCVKQRQLNFFGLDVLIQASQIQLTGFWKCISDIYSGPRIQLFLTVLFIPDVLFHTVPGNWTGFKLIWPRPFVPSWLLHFCPFWFLKTHRPLTVYKNPGTRFVPLIWIMFWKENKCTSGHEIDSVHKTSILHSSQLIF